jgi:hypothetical protein
VQDALVVLAAWAALEVQDVQVALAAWAASGV